ncbi:MAG: ammonia-forming cytochrome c nitrite reductase [Deltaproteobacteria bacterium]|nr:ammonia-forming cytochrome c nitrite reductase [Deltaproteobacteria bacterium]
MKSASELVKEHPWIGWILFLGTMGMVFVLGLFAATILGRRNEAIFAYKPATDIRPYEPRNSFWGKYFPREFETYEKTAETNFRSKYNGSEKIDMLAEDPRLVVLWAGYAFSTDYSQGRGHHYAIQDIRETLRTGAPKNEQDGSTPNTCWTCKSPDVARLMSEMTPEEFYKGKWASRGSEIVNSIGCADCHDPASMNLRITRPALSEAFSRQGKDINASTQQEMRSLVCAQCHVEYYFKGEGKYVTFPWDKGITVEAIEDYYDSYQFNDWTHSISKAPMLKAQHPDWEIAQMGIHAQRGVSCADCHMPYIAEGAVKFTNHHIQSPLAMINTSCQVCHRESEEELKRNVYDRQTKVFELRVKAEDHIVRAHFEAKKAWDLGAKPEEMAEILKLIRHAQWRWDWTAAGHGSSFHAPLEMARILGTAIDKAQQARLLLVKLLANYGFNDDVAVPDISTKDKALTAIGVDINSLKRDKQEFLEKLVPKWDEEARKRESSWPQ